MKWKLELGAWHKSQDDKNKQTNNSNFWNNVVALLFTKLYYYFQNNQLMMDDKLLFLNNNKWRSHLLWSRRPKQLYEITKNVLVSDLMMPVMDSFVF